MDRRNACAAQNCLTLDANKDASAGSRAAEGATKPATCTGAIWRGSFFFAMLSIYPCAISEHCFHGVASITEGAAESFARLDPVGVLQAWQPSDLLAFGPVTRMAAGRGTKTLSCHSSLQLLQPILPTESFAEPLDSCLHTLPGFCSQDPHDLLADFNNRPAILDPSTLLPPHSTLLTATTITTRAKGEKPIKNVLWSKERRQLSCSLSESIKSWTSGCQNWGATDLHWYVTIPLYETKSKCPSHVTLVFCMALCEYAIAWP